MSVVDGRWMPYALFCIRADAFQGKRHAVAVLTPVWELITVYYTEPVCI